MPDWQERITRETPPQIRLEHVVRYAAAVPLIAARLVVRPRLRDGPRGRGGGRRAEARALRRRRRRRWRSEAAARFPDAEATTSRSTSRATTACRPCAICSRTGDGPCITCFELIEHLDDFGPLCASSSSAPSGSDGRAQRAERLAQRSRESVPRGDVGRGLARGAAPLLPASTRARAGRDRRLCAPRQPTTAPRDVTVDVRLEPVAGPSHMLRRVRPACRRGRAPRRAKVVDADEHALWERQREAELAFFEARLALLEKQ